MYDIKNNILALQRNRDSLSSSGIEYYLNKLYNSKEYEVYLRPIKPDDMKERLDKAKFYRRLTMRFANIPSGGYRGDKGSSFYSLLQYFNRFSANCATITVSLGRERKRSLESETISEAVEEINNNRGLVDAAEIVIKNSEIDPVDTIDLFSMKSHDFISLRIENRETIDYLVLADEIHKKYNRSKEKLINLLNE